MASSFNFDMDRYLEKRLGSVESKRTNSSSSQSSRKKKQKGAIATLTKLKNVVKSLLDADEVLNIETYDEDNNVSIYHKKSFVDKLSDLVEKSKRKSSKNNDKIEIVDEEQQPSSAVSNENDTVSKKPEFLTKETIKEEIEEHKQKQASSDRRPNESESTYSSSRDFFTPSSSGNNSSASMGTSQEYKQDFVNSSRSTSFSLDARSEFRNDLREIVKINYRVIKQLPPETIKAFRESADFKQFVAILDKYDLIKHRNK